MIFQSIEHVVRVGQLLFSFIFPNIFTNVLVAFYSRLRNFVSISYSGNYILMPEPTVICKRISEQEVGKYFGDVTNDKLSVIIHEAIYSIKRVEDGGFKEWLKNTSLNMYLDEKCYKFRSGNGKNRIVVNYENERPVTEFLGFPEMD